jgi:trigger factor
VGVRVPSSAPERRSAAMLTMNGRSCGGFLENNQINMDISKESVDNLNAVLKIRIEETDYNDRVDAVLKDYRKKVTMDGFRPGKVPAGLVNKMYRKPVMVEEINKMISESISKYLTEENINILGEPLPSEQQQNQIDWDTQTEFEFDFDLGLAPQLEISLSQKDKVPLYEIQLDDKMISDSRESYARRMGTMIPVEQIEGTELVKADFMQIDKEGNPIDGGILSPDAQFSMEVIKDDKIKTSFMARQSGDMVDMNIRDAFPNDTEIASLLKIDKATVPEIVPNFRVAIKEISRFQKADINQDLWDQLYGKDVVKSEAEFEEKIREELRAALSKDSEYRFTIDARMMMLKKIKFDLPVEFLKRWLVVANEGKYTAEQIDEDFPKFEDDLKWQLIRDQIVKDQEIKVDAEELKAQAKEITRLQFQQYGMMNIPEENLENYANEMLKNEDDRRKSYEKILENKVIDYLKTSVRVDKKQINVEKFNKLFENN